MDKKILRKILTEKRNAVYAANNFNELCFNLHNHIVIHTLFQNAKIICTYAPTKSEIEVNLITQKAWELQKTVLFPRCSKTEKGLMHFYGCKDFSDLEQGAFGILEPKEMCPLYDETILNSPKTLVLVPALAFSPRGWRLGYGQGFYDRFLAKIPLAVSLGITLTALLSDDIPIDAWDKAVNFLATEKDIQKI